MAREKKAKPETSNAQSLVDAIAFAKPCYREAGESYQTHIIMRDKMLYAFDGILACGVPVADDLAACPQGHANET